MEYIKIERLFIKIGLIAMIVIASNAAFGQLITNGGFAGTCTDVSAGCIPGWTAAQGGPTGVNQISLFRGATTAAQCTYRHDGVVTTFPAGFSGFKEGAKYRVSLKMKGDNWMYGAGYLEYARFSVVA